MKEMSVESKGNSEIGEQPVRRGLFMINYNNFSSNERKALSLEALSVESNGSVKSGKQRKLLMQKAMKPLSVEIRGNNESGEQAIRRRLFMVN